MLRHARADWQLHILPLSSFECSCGGDLLNTLLTFPVSVSVGEMLGVTMGFHHGDGKRGAPARNNKRYPLNATETGGAHPGEDGGSERRQEEGYILNYG